MNITETTIAQLLPHAGDMLLIDRVIAWDERRIRCRSDSHRKSDHPLRLQGRLSALHLIEYGAQAMGIHGGLLQGGARPGYLAAIRNARLGVDHLDAIEGSLHIEAAALGQSDQGAIYQLDIRDAQGRLLLNARATVMHPDTNPP
ncbi:MAG: phosphotransferase [Gammaproteobacteria bacterium]